mgnify:CR=1 FL=1
MKRIFLVFLIVLVTVVGCKDLTRKNQSSDKIDKSAKKEEVRNNIILPNYALWTLSRLTMEETNNNLTYNEKQEFILSRTSTTETAYVSLNNIAVTYGNDYRISIIVKKATLGNLFGLRIIGEYPNRIDAVFDLKKGLLKEVVDVGDFLSGEGLIEDMGNGWFKCSLKGEVYADKIKIILGPTSGLGRTITWEGPTSDKCNNYIIPTSLTLEEILY